MDSYPSCSRLCLTSRLTGRMLCPVLAVLFLATAGRPDVGHAAGVEPAVAFQGMISLPNHADDADGKSVEITGLSGVAWLGDDEYVAVMDNSQHLLLFRLSLTQTGKPIAVESLRIVTLSQRHDYEDVVPCPGAVVQAMQRDRGRTAVERGKNSEPCVLVCEEDTPARRLPRR